MKILILEDEHLVAESLIKLVKQLEPDAELQGPVDNVADAKTALSADTPDLVISDIQLSDGISLDAFAEAKVQCPVIFTTAYNEYAIRAFKVNSIDYLLKPIDKKELKAAFDKFHQLRSKFSNEQYLQQLGELFNDFKSGKKYKDRFTAHHGRNIVLVHSRDVAGFAKEEVNYLVHSDGKKYITDYRSLDEIEELLDPEQFYRANRQYIISLPQLDTLRSDESGKVIVRLKPQSFPEIIVSKDKAAAFRRWVEG